MTLTLFQFPPFKSRTLLSFRLRYLKSPLPRLLCSRRQTYLSRNDNPSTLSFCTHLPDSIPSAISLPPFSLTFHRFDPWLTTHFRQNVTTEFWSLALLKTERSITPRIVGWPPISLKNVTTAYRSVTFGGLLNPVRDNPLPPFRSGALNFLRVS